MKVSPMLHVLEYLSYFEQPLEKKILIENVLYNMKSNRKGLKKEEIDEKGLNIYEKKTVSIHSLIEQAVSQNFVKHSYVLDKNKEVLELTRKGLDRLFEWYTNNNSEDYASFQEQVKELTVKYQEPEIEDLQIAKLYWYGKSVEDVEGIYFKENPLQDRTKKFHKFVLNLMESKVEKDSIIFHIQPKLFLTRDDMFESVSLRIEGLPNPKNLILGKPYRNKRYVVAGFREGKQKLYTGYYPIILPKEEFPKELELTYHWFIGDEKEVVHKMNITFEENTGNFYSSVQILSRTNRILNFDLISMTKEDEALFNRKRDFSISISENGKVETIVEKVKLISFPIHLHSFDYGNISFQKVTDSFK